MRPWKSIIIYLATTVFLLTLTGHLYSPVSRDPFADDDLIVTGEDFMDKINTTNPRHANFFISSPAYKHRLKPKVHLDGKVKDYQPVTYFLAAELARRYNARYIIDVGCGSASKLAKLAGEFIVIGVDHGANYKKAKDTYPYLTFMDTSLDRGKKCYVKIPKEVLFQAVVISADVIEHLIDPFYCYIKLLNYMARYAMALVISSPDRERSARVFKNSQTISGPPVNQRHVREWTIKEMDRLLTENGFAVMVSGWICNKYDGCDTGFMPSENPFPNQLTVIGNKNIRRMWREGKTTSATEGMKVTAFLLVYPHTNPTIAEYNLQIMLTQRLHVVLIRVNNSMTLNIPIAGRVVIDQLSASQPKDIVNIITGVFSKGFYNYGDWFFIQDAHEVLTLKNMPAWNITLPDAFVQISQEPYGFNAVAYSFFFMYDLKGRSFQGMPFKIFAANPWDSGSQDGVGAVVDTYKDRVRAWRKTTHKLVLNTVETSKGHVIVTDVHFLGRKVYPYHVLSLRTPPSKTFGRTILKGDLSRMYALDAALGFMPSARKKIMTNRFLY